MTEIYERIIVRDNYIYTGCYHQSVSNLPFLRATPGERDGWADEAQASVCEKRVAGRETVRGRGKVERKKRLHRDLQISKISNIIESSGRDGSNGWIEEDNRTMKDKETKDKREKEKRQGRRGIVPSTFD